VRSAPGAGSSFTVHVPLQRTAGAETGVPGVDGLRVLVVDDQRDTLVTVQACCSAWAWAPGAASMAPAMADTAALRWPPRPLPKTNRYDLLLLDWVLPDTDGARLLAELRSTWPQLRVVVITAYGRGARSAPGCQTALR
jgi:two-component system sensor histidine kinase/response regulator